MAFGFNHSDTESEGEVVQHDNDQDSSKEETSKIGSGTTTVSQNKRQGRKNLPANGGTGFSYGYCDPPPTAEEIREEREEIYNPERSIADRIQDCISRYRARRRLQPERSRYFNEYLFLGGIDTSPAQFRGQDPKELKQMTPAERRQAVAHDIVMSHNDRFYDGDPEKWTVDFTGVAAGFFSNPLLELTDLEPARIDKAVNVVENFLRYVLYHDVCPEYEDDIKNALKLCGNVRSEWASVDTLSQKLPGMFNQAAYYSFCADVNDGWATEETLDTERVSFLSSLALLDDDKLFLRHSSGEHKVARSFLCTVEVVDIHRPEEHVVKRFESLHIDDSSLELNAVGSATFVPTTIETDMVESPMPRPFEEEKMTLYFDDDLLALMKPGTKMKLNICELDTGFRFVQMVGPVYPSFYTFLPQEMMKFFKPPRPNERPAPSIHTKEDNDEDGDNE